MSASGTPSGSQGRRMGNEFSVSVWTRLHWSLMDGELSPSFLPQVRFPLSSLTLRPITNQPEVG